MKELNDKIVGNLSCFAAYAIFGFNIISCRSIALDGNITPMALPFSFSAFGASDLAAVPMNVMWQVIFVVVAATFIAYFLIPIGQKRLKPVIVCMYTYVQPVIAMAISLAMGMDTLNWLKIIATVLVFSGVGLVNFVPKSNVNSHSGDDFQGVDEG